MRALKKAREGAGALLFIGLVATPLGWLCADPFAAAIKSFYLHNAARVRVNHLNAILGVKIDSKLVPRAALFSKDAHESKRGCLLFRSH